MLNPIDTEKVIRDGAACGQYPGEIHEGVGWWIGACLVVVTHANRIAVAHDGYAASALFQRCLCRGTMNAQHYACTVMDLHVADEHELLSAMKELGGVPGVLITTTPDAGTETVRIALYDRHGEPLGEDAGLARIRQMIADDHVPIPVNDQARGHVEDYVPPEGTDQ